MAAEIRDGERRRSFGLLTFSAGAVEHVRAFGRRFAGRTSRRNIAIDVGTQARALTIDGRTIRTTALNTALRWSNLTKFD